MSFVICDTNIFISLFRNIPETVKDLELIGSGDVLISSVSVMELYRGMQNKNEMAEMRKKISKYNVLHFNEDVSKHAIELVNNYKLSHNLQIPDAIIGAMGIVYNIEIFTYNKKDFKFIPGIKLYESSITPK